MRSKFKKGDPAWLDPDKSPMLAEIHGPGVGARLSVDDVHGDQAMLRADGIRMVASTRWLLHSAPGTTPEGW